MAEAGITNVLVILSGQRDFGVVLITQLGDPMLHEDVAELQVSGKMSLMMRAQWSCQMDADAFAT